MAGGRPWCASETRPPPHPHAPRLQVRLWDKLRAAGLPPRAARAAALARGRRGAEGEGPPRLALNSEEAILWLNDLERDPQYAAWPSSLTTLLMPMFPGERFWGWAGPGAGFQGRARQLRLPPSKVLQGTLQPQLQLSCAGLARQ